MILPWTSSVNNEILPSGYSQYTRKQAMIANIWNLYACLTSSYWTPVSSSYSSSNGYLTGVCWDNISQIGFPETMCNKTLDEVIESNNVNHPTDPFIYQPSEHSWVTLSKSCDDGSAYFITIDCRYPLPPHKPNVDVVIERDIKKQINNGKYNLLTDRSLRSEVFLGMSGIIKDIGIPAKKIIDADANGFPDDDIPANGFLNAQEINVFKGIAFREPENTRFSILSSNISNGQDYTSRTAAFVDIVFHKGNNSLIKKNDPINDPNDDSTYFSATTRVRPKASKEDSNCWYVCWAFDYLELLSTSESFAISDFVDHTKYNFAFHTCSAESIEFIYQTYNTTDASFKSCIGLLPVKNKQATDTYTHTSICINCDPSKVYYDRNINFNTIGKEIALLQNSTTTTLSNQILNLQNTPPKYTVNNFFNTCFRNYNFSDGINVIKAGEADSVGKRGAMPIFASLRASDSVILSEKLTYTSCSYTSISGQNINTWEPPSDNSSNLYVGADTPQLQLSGTLNEPPIAATSTKNNICYRNGEYKYYVKPVFSSNNSDLRVAYCFNEEGDRKLVFNSEGQLYKFKPSDVFAGTRPVGIGFNASPNIIGVGDSQMYDKALTKNNFQSIFFTLPTREGKITLSSYKTKNPNWTLNSLFNDSIFCRTDSSGRKLISLYIGEKEVFHPKGDVLIPFGSTENFRPTISNLSTDIINHVKSINNDTDGYEQATKLNWYRRYVYPNSEPIKIVSSKTLAAQRKTPSYQSARNKGILPKPGIFWKEHVYIDVTLEEIYSGELNIPQGTLILNNGNFSSIHDDESLPGKDQTYGANFFSTFKCASKMPSSFKTFQEPLAVSLYTFGKNKYENSNKSIFGLVNYQESFVDKKFLADRDGTRSYSELPIFLFSINESSGGKFKGFIPDVSLAPSSISDCTLVKNTNPNPATTYDKIYWAGFWWPWVTSTEPNTA